MGWDNGRVPPSIWVFPFRSHSDGVESYQCLTSCFLWSLLYYALQKRYRLYLELLCPPRWFRNGRTSWSQYGGRSRVTRPTSHPLPRVCASWPGTVVGHGLYLLGGSWAWKRQELGQDPVLRSCLRALAISFGPAPSLSVPRHPGTPHHLDVVASLGLRQPHWGAVRQWLLLVEQSCCNMLMSCLMSAKYIAGS